MKPSLVQTSLLFLYLTSSPATSLPNKYIGRSAISGPSTPLPFLEEVEVSREFGKGRKGQLTTKISTLIETYPTSSNLFQGLLLFTLSDLLAQIIHSPPGLPEYTKSLVKLDIDRSLKAGIFGMFYSGGLIASWIRWIDFKFPSSRLGLNAIIKVLLDILVFGIIGNSLNILIRGCFSSGCPNGLNIVKLKMGRVFKNDLKVFPVADLLCFSVVRKEFRASFVGVVSLGWNTWISIVSYDEGH
ncbi:hypothetical protein TrLO_g11618 [Triparma laevis f. longispina]|uniref:Uncharacterized protein n=1 Tax=Triparma laevis f. longispina TaxID=1714387 RepID=A0A9W7AUM9_9STRA|nr:hypothetical protein TrLO_g11618 [Triparma laevis f. longispina]